MILDGGALEGTRLLGSGTVAHMSRDHLGTIPTTRPLGIGCSALAADLASGSRWTLAATHILTRAQPEAFFGAVPLEHSLSLIRSARWRP